MKISTVIPTYKREKDLSECLDSILIQSHLPLEVFVIDNGKSLSTKEVVSAKKDVFTQKGMKLEYIENVRENSLTVARNLGVRLCAGDIVSFLDDDVALDKDYFKETEIFFQNNKEALGMCGKTMGNLYENNKLKFFVSQIIGKIFLIGFNEEDQCRVLPSLGVTSPKSDEVVSCQWIGGASSFYRIKVFSEFSFDENLKKYSWSEDLDFSYRIYKKYPGTLFFNPKVKYLHKLSNSGRTVGRELAFMEEVYNLYLFYKLIPQNFKNKAIYIWARIGTISYKILKLRFLDVYFAFEAFFLCIKYLKNIKGANLDFFNKTLK